MNTPYETNERTADQKLAELRENSPTANMYGCEPCPKCGSKYRCVFAKTPDRIDCDDCGYVEKAESSNQRRRSSQSSR